MITEADNGFIISLYIEFEYENLKVNVEHLTVVFAHVSVQLDPLCSNSTPMKLVHGMLPCANSAQ